MFVDGNGVERDYNQAEYWLKKSLAGGNDQARELLDNLQSKIRSQTITQPTNIELDEVTKEFLQRENIPSSYCG